MKAGKSIPCSGCRAFERYLRKKTEKISVSVLVGLVMLGSFSVVAGETVKVFETAPLVDKAAAELFPTWKDNFEEWKKVGSDRPYHYLGSGIWYSRIGKAAGEAMVDLLAE